MSDLAFSQVRADVSKRWPEQTSPGRGVKGSQVQILSARLYFYPFGLVEKGRFDERDLT